MPSIPSAQYSLTVQVELDRKPGMLGRLTSAIGEAGGDIGALDIVKPGARVVREITIDTAGLDHAKQLLEAIEGVEGVELLSSSDRTFELHRGGKIFTGVTAAVTSHEQLSMAYTPGVARVCKAIAEDPEQAFEFTIKRNTVAIVSDGTAVLGLGDIGPEAAMPVMEGKAMLFKEFANVDAFPICLSTTDTDEIVAAVKAIAPTFGGINLEDISGPRCFEIEDRCKEALDIPVFHDDQHGTAVVVMAAMLNSLRLTGKRLEDIRVLVVGLGAAGVAVTKILLRAGVRHLIGCDSKGALSTTRSDYADGSLGEVKRWYAEQTNRDCRGGSPADVIEGADVFIGVSGARVLPAEALARMNEDAIVFAMANPDPEVSPEQAAPHVRIMATGRSDYPNQINNVLCFPGIFRGALDARAHELNDQMMMAAAEAIAGIVTEEELREDYIIPSVFNRDVAPAVAAAVAERAQDLGVGEPRDEMGFAATEEHRVLEG